MQLSDDQLCCPNYCSSACFSSGKEGVIHVALDPAGGLEVHKHLQRKKCFKTTALDKKQLWQQQRHHQQQPVENCVHLVGRPGLEPGDLLHVGLVVSGDDVRLVLETSPVRDDRTPTFQLIVAHVDPGRALGILLIDEEEDKA